jgi:hypothetical protein
MGHQDHELELKAILEALEADKKPAEPVLVDEVLADEATEATPLAIDHDAVRSWRETARFFRKAA